MSATASTSSESIPSMVSPYVGPSRNPYVKDPFWFLGREEEAERQRRLSDFHFWNNIMGGSVGLVLLVLVLYLIVRRTPGPYKPYSRMLLFTAIGDLIFIFVIPFGSQTRIRIVDNCLLLTFTGLISYVENYELIAAFVAIHTATAMLSCTMLFAQCYYRYKFIRTGYHPTSEQSIRYFLIAMAVAGSCGLGFYIPFRFSGRSRPGFDYGQLWYAEAPIPTLIVGVMDHPLTILSYAYCTTVSTLCYSLSLISLFRTVQIMRTEHKMGRSVQHQVTRTLLAQTLAPLGGAIVPTLGAFVDAALDMDVGHAAQAAPWALVWFPVLNCLSTLCFIVPYRRFCASKILGKAYADKTATRSYHMSRSMSSTSKHVAAIQVSFTI